MGVYEVNQAVFWIYLLVGPTMESVGPRPDPELSVCRFQGTMDTPRSPSPRHPSFSACKSTYRVRCIVIFFFETNHRRSPAKKRQNSNVMVTSLCYLSNTLDWSTVSSEFNDTSASSVLDSRSLKSMDLHERDSTSPKAPSLQAVLRAS